MKRLDFDVFALITPLSKPVAVLPDTKPINARPNDALRLANSIRANRFILPQRLLVGKQITRGPSPVRVLRFGPYQVRDFALRKVILSLSASDLRSVRSYLWNTGSMVKVEGRWIELDPPFTPDTEAAFNRILSTLEQLCLLEPCDATSQIEEESNGGSTL